jgi:hypothetical protein
VDCSVDAFDAFFSEDDVGLSGAFLLSVFFEAARSGLDFLA